MTLPNQVRNQLPPKDPVTGARLRYGNGCTRGGANCFECLLPKCIYNSSNEYYYKRRDKQQLALF